jgi:hypothetical protein
MRLSIRHAIYLTREKRSDRPPLDQEQIVWDAYNITFGHLVAVDDKDPEAIQLYVDEDLRVTLGTSKARVNATAQDGGPNWSWGKKILMSDCSGIS